MTVNIQNSDVLVLYSELSIKLMVMQDRLYSNSRVDGILL